METTGRRRSVLPSLLFCGQYFVDVDLYSSFSKLADIGERSVDFLLPTVYFRHNPGSGHNAEVSLRSTSSGSRGKRASDSDPLI